MAEILHKTQRISSRAAFKYNLLQLKEEEKKKNPSKNKK